MAIVIVLLLLVNVAAFIWLDVKAFKTGIGWGFAVLFIPFFSVVYTVKWWGEAKNPFLTHITSALAAVLIVAVYMPGSVRSYGTVIPSPKTGTPQGASSTTLTPEQKATLDLTEKGLKLLEKFPQNEKSRKIIAVTRGYIRHRKEGSTDAQRTELSQQMAKLLQRSDLAQNERRSIEKMARELEQANVRPVSIPSQSPGQEKSQSVDASAQAPAPPNEKSTGVVSAVVPPREAAPAPQLGDPALQTDSAPVYKEIRSNRAKDFLGSTVLLNRGEGEEEVVTLVGVSGRSLEFEKHVSGGTFSVWYKDSEIKSMKVLVKKNK